ncbi:cysteine hydrolase [Nocardia nova]|uniref:Cysteine hydrolase n=1 Tax=Nocardia nova TaxID=37330 RepID=A0A2S6AVR3_9NOCA|nr:cysteine hydrolase [Nocardia nova]PPJ33498.1 cysteine hydrolase [Nocardia nova]PPJ39289.1 cysteine hydrolase [Nocardia nova]
MSSRNAASGLDPASTALVCVECQTGVVGPDPVLPSLADESKKVVRSLARLLPAVRKAGVRVVHVTFEGLRPGADPGSAPLWKATAQSREWYPGHPAAQVLPELFDESDVVISRRHGLSPTRGTDLSPNLRTLGIRTVLLTGVSLNVALPATALDLGQDGFRLLVVRDAVGASSPEYGEQVLRNTMAMLGRLTTVDDVVTALTETAVTA